MRGTPGPGGVLFRAAGSAHIGYGHVVRVLHLAAALGVPPIVSIRGSVAAAETARRLGARLVSARPGTLARTGLRLLIIDDPSTTAGISWVRAARRAGGAVVSLHDRGIAPLPSDLAVDGSLGARNRRGLGRPGAVRCLGPRFAVLAPGLVGQAVASRAARRPTVVISLGGGGHAAAGLAVARALAAIRPSRARILLSLGLDTAVSQVHTAWPDGVEAIAPQRLRSELARATLAVVAGGTTLYEACALGTPAVAVAVVPGQRGTVAAFGRHGLARTPISGARPPVGTPAWGAAVAAAAADLWDDAAARRAIGAAARRTIDGRGVKRVARAIQRLWATKAPTA